MKTHTIISLLVSLLTISGCSTDCQNNIQDPTSLRARLLRSEKVVGEFISWHNDFFSKGEKALTKKKLQQFFADNLYFEFNGRAISHNIDDMIRGYRRIKAKDKIVIIGDLEKVEFRLHGEGVTEVWVMHDTTSIEKDGRRKIHKAEVSFFIKNGLIERYIEKFD